MLNIRRMVLYYLNCAAMTVSVIFLNNKLSKLQWKYIKYISAKITFMVGERSINATVLYKGAVG